MKPTFVQSLPGTVHDRSARFSQANRRRVFTLVVAFLAIAFIGLPVSADPKKKKKDNCLIVTITNWKTVTNVALERWEPTPQPGQWVAVAKRMIRKNDNSETEFCGLTPDATYRVRATSQLGSSPWSQPFVFQPNSETGTMSTSLTLQ